MHHLPDELSKHLIDELVQRHYGVVENSIPTDVLEGLRECFRDRSFRPARVGRASLSDSSIRNDEICWIDAADLRAPEKALFEILEDLRVKLNRELFLGLVDFEAHYARYDAGHFYSRHVDRFNDESARTISVVLYLNENWTDADGGQLRLHMDPPVDIRPSAGTLVCFTSENVEHEVLTSHRARMSIAAWFRRSRK